MCSLSLFGTGERYDKAIKALNEEISQAFEELGENASKKEIEDLVVERFTSTDMWEEKIGLDR